MAIVGAHGEPAAPATAAKRRGLTARDSRSPIKGDCRAAPHHSERRYGSHCQNGSYPTSVRSIDEAIPAAHQRELLPRRAAEARRGGPD